jgi:hypothetical protein
LFSNPLLAPTLSFEALIAFSFFAALSFLGFATSARVEGCV